MLGLGLGVILNNFIITTVETDTSSCWPGIDPSNISCFLPAYSPWPYLIVNIFMAPVIKVDMVESPKSIE